jgi:protein SCO1/2
MRRFLIITSVFVALLVVAGGAFLLMRPYVFHGTVIQSPEPSPDFTLDSASGPVSLSDFKGKVVVLYFGYTFCPDVCPTTLSDLAQAMQILGTKASDVQVVMVTVDPERDTADRLASYVQSFDPAFLGLTGSSQDVATAAALYGVYYSKHEGTVATGYLVDHTASVMILNRDGRLKLVLPFGTEPPAIASDLAHVLS